MSKLPELHLFIDSQCHNGLCRQNIAYGDLTPVVTFKLPSGKLTQLWKITIFNGNIHYKWPFSIAMLVHQRVLKPPDASSFSLAVEFRHPSAATGFKIVSSALREGGVLFIQVYNDRAKAGFHYTQSFRTLSLGWHGDVEDGRIS